MKSRLLLAILLLTGCAAKAPEKSTRVTQVIPHEELERCIVGDMLCMNDDCSKAKFLRLKDGCVVLKVDPIPQGGLGDEPPCAPDCVVIPQPSEGKAEN